MVRSFRESLFGQIVLGAIVIAIILAFALTGSSGGGVVTSDCAVEVGRHCISPKDFQAAYGLVTSIGINEKAAKSLKLKDQVARGLAEREVLIARARELGIATSEADVDVELAEGRTRVSLPVKGAERLALNLALCVDGPTGCEPGTVGLRSIPVKKDGVFNYDRYKRTVRVATGRSPGHFKEAQQKELSADRVRAFYRAQVQVSEEEAYLAYRRARSQATARLARVATDWFSRFVVDLTDEQVEAWARTHEADLQPVLEAEKDGYQVGCPLVSEIRLAEATEGEDTTEQLQALRTKIRSSKDFALAARRLSTAPSAAWGGWVGCLDKSYGPVSEVLLAGLAGVKEGAMSEVLATVEGPTLLWVGGFVTQETRAAQQRAAVARRLATQAQAKEAAGVFARTLIERLRSGASIADATEALIGETLANGPWSNADSPARTAEDRPTTDISRQFSIEQNPLRDAVGDVPVAKLVFDLAQPDDVLGEPVETQQGYAVLQLKEKEMATREDFAEDRALVIASLRARKAEELLGQVVAEMIERAGGIRIDRGFIPEEEAASTTPDPGSNGS